MLQQTERTIISLKHEQRQALSEMARGEGQEVEAFIEHLLQHVIEQRQISSHQEKMKRVQQQFALIRQHRKALLEKHQNHPLNADTIAILNQLREERDEHLFSLITDACR